jgi:hypothetical protein
MPKLTTATEFANVNCGSACIAVRRFADGRSFRVGMTGVGSLGAISLTWAQVAVIALLAIGLYVLELLAFMRSARRQADAERRTRERIDAQAAEIGSLRARLDNLDAAIDGLRRAPQSSGQYREAVEMAERGSDAATVADSCGISRAEADLIVALYRSRAA